MRMLKIFKVVVSLSLLQCAICQSGSNESFDYHEYTDGNIYSGDYIYYNEGTEPSTSTSTRELSEVKEKSDLVEKLYSKIPGHRSFDWSKSTDEDNETFCGFGWLWELEQLQNTVELQGGILSNDEKESLLSSIKNDIQREVDKSPDDSLNNCSEFYHKLRSNREHLDCVLGPQVVTSLFSEMNPDNSDCWSYTEKFWRRIVSAGDIARKGCSASDVYDDLIAVGQVKGGRYEADFKSIFYAKPFRLMAKTTEMISRPERLEYLARVSCGPNTPALSCVSITSKVGLTTCNVINVGIISDIEKEIANGVTSPGDTRIMLDLMTDLTKILHELSENKLQNEMKSAKVAEINLEVYLDIMDQAIGESARGVWTELAVNETKEQLQLVLVNNDEYIGAMSRIMFDSKKDRMLDKSLNRDSMAVDLRQLESKNESELVEFQFSDTRIETLLPGHNETNKFNVYAIHYKSWAELLQKEGLKANGAQNATKTKFFVGEGGIVSLTLRTDDGHKSSTSVKYKMAYKNATIDESLANGVSRRLCMSCEFFNTETGEWENTGCSVINVAGDGVTCQCNHTTNFAAFMSPVSIEIEMTEQQRQAKQIVSYMGSTVSVLSLTISLIIFNIVKPSIKNDRLKAHVNLALALLMVHMTQLVTDFVVGIDTACLTVAILTHFFLLASFVWMLIEGIFLYLYVVQVFVHSTIEYLRWLYVAGWVLPALIVATSAGVAIPRDTYLDVYPDYCEETEILHPPLDYDQKYKQCWLSVESGMVWSFIGPALVIIVFNSIILCKVFQVLRKVSSRSSNIRPFQPPASSSKKDTSSGFFNKTYGRNELESQKQYVTESKLQKSKNLPESTGDYGSTSLSTGHSGHNPNDSPSRFDARVPSQAYMHNRAHPIKTSPERINENGKHFLPDVRAALKGAMILLPILGIPWIFGFWAASSYFAMMLFLVINSTQGLAIFVVYCLMNGEVKRAIQRRIKTAKLRSQTGRSRASSTSSLRSLNSRFTRSWKTSSSEPPKK